MAKPRYDKLHPKANSVKTAKPAHGILKKPRIKILEDKPIPKVAFVKTKTAVPKTTSEAGVPKPVVQIAKTAAPKTAIPKTASEVGVPKPAVQTAKAAAPEVKFSKSQRRRKNASARKSSSPGSANNAK